MSKTQCTSARVRTFGSTLLVLGLLCLGACTVQPTTPPRPADVQSLENRARIEAESGNVSAAANLYTQLAMAVTGTLRSRYLIEAARLSIVQGDIATARRRLGEVRETDREQQQTVATLNARIELEQGRPQPALDLLAQLQQPISVPVLREAAAVRGQALFRLGRHADAVRVLVDREVWLDDAAQILANQRMIWDSFRAPSMPAAVAPTGDPVIDGWLALAPLARSGDPSDLRRALLGWRETYTNHPAAGGLLADLLTAQRAEGFPTHIALLLPMSSAQRIAALAIRDGFLAAHLRSARGRDSRIQIYDTALVGAAEAYLRAQLDGAEFIVGPLLRPEVEEVISQAGFVPTLALNFAQNETPLLRSFYQFALAPADEARAVAQHAAAQGATTAIALVRSETRGYDILNAFRTEFEALGGELLEFSGYDPNLQDFSAPITALLNLARSNQRYRRLAANLGTPIQFEPRRRQDVDLIFIAADARTARLLGPQLRFHSAGNVPTYATSDIFVPGDASRENDLNGLIFPDVPALLAPDQASTALRSELQVYWPQRAAAQVRYYGMGFDAYRLVSSLYDPDASSWPLQGMSGDLTLNADGKIHRALPLAQFRGGRPVALDTVTPRGEEARGLVGFR